jgi:hypothetical protein
MNPYRPENLYYMFQSERSADMFCDDIFGESPAGIRKSGKDDGLHIERNALHDNWDDADGYYSKLCYLMVIFLPVSLFFLRSNFAHVCPFIHSLVSATLQLTGLGN